MKSPPKKCVPTLKELNSYYNNFEGLKIKVSKYKNRGLGIKAQEDIPVGRVVAYYRVKLVPVDKKTKCGEYTVSMSKHNDGHLDETLVYDMYRNIPYVGCFCNEPKHDHDVNVSLYKTSRKLQGFEDMKLVSTRFIKKGEEIVWCYGKMYGKRKYDTSCDQPA